MMSSRFIDAAMQVGWVISRLDEIIRIESGPEQQNVLGKRNHQGHEEQGQVEMSNITYGESIRLAIHTVNETRYCY